MTVVSVKKKIIPIVSRYIDRSTAIKNIYVKCFHPIKTTEKILSYILKHIF